MEVIKHFLNKVITLFTLLAIAAAFLFPVFNKDGSLIPVEKSTEIVELVEQPTVRLSLEKIETDEESRAVLSQHMDSTSFEILSNDYYIDARRLQRTIFFGDTILCRWGVDPTADLSCKDCYHLSDTGGVASIDLVSHYAHIRDRDYEEAMSPPTITASAKVLKTSWPVLEPSAKVLVTRAGQHAYALRYRKVAQDEQKLYGIPAAITLAQGIIESKWGTSTLCTEANNHFGIKHRGTVPEWAGESESYYDRVETKFATYRVYPSAWWSFRDHSRFLTGVPRYKFLFKIDPHDYKGWAYGLKKAGYATDKYYAEKLINLIEELHLDQYSYLTPEKFLASR